MAKNGLGGAIDKTLFGKKVKKVAVVNMPTVKLESPDAPEMKPTLYLTSKDLPEIKDWRVGDTYELHLKVRQTGLDIQKYDGEKKWCAHFEIESVENGEDYDE